MPKIEFRKEPPLWPEEYTDFFNINTNAYEGELKEGVERALENFEHGCDYLFINSTQIAVENQLAVFELMEMLYGLEVAYQHTHIPKYER